MNEKISHKHLIERYTSNKASSEELEVFDALIREGEIDEVLMSHMEDSWKVAEAAFMAEQPKRIRLWPRFAAAAVILLALSAGLIFYLNRNGHVSQNIVKNDLAPGTNKAILTLADGKTISLSDAKTGLVIDASKLTYNDGTTVTEITSRNNVINPVTISTPRAGTYQVSLPDGTKVWLNAMSSIKFPTQFAKIGSRNVELTGEAYFEVTKDKSHPFVVNTAKQAVEVLGTHFNISSYADETVSKTTLLEGAVKVTAKGTANATILKPGEQAVLDLGAIKVNEVDTEQMVAWKHGYFKFVDEDMQSIMRQISRWYDVDIQYEGKVPADVFSGRISKFKNISEVLRLIESANSVHFKVEGRRVTVIG